MGVLRRVERWWIRRRPNQRWPFFTRCVDCGRVNEVWGRPVGFHAPCETYPC